MTEMKFVVGVPGGCGDGCGPGPVAWSGALPIGATVRGHGCHECIATVWSVEVPVGDAVITNSDGRAFAARLTAQLGGMLFPAGHPACGEPVSTRLSADGDAVHVVVMVGMSVARYCELSPTPFPGVTWASYVDGAASGTMDWFVFA